MSLTVATCLWLSLASASGPGDALHLSLTRRSTTPPTGKTAPLVSTLFNTDFDVNVTIGGQTFPLLVDTGSSDTYVVKKDFQCVNRTDGSALLQAACLYGPATYTPSSTYSEIPNEFFGVQYGAGIASGVLAHEMVTIAGITVENATVAIANMSTYVFSLFNHACYCLAE
jgi:hypothetical protein